MTATLFCFPQSSDASTSAANSPTIKEHSKSAFITMVASSKYNYTFLHYPIIFINITQYLMTILHVHVFLNCNDHKFNNTHEITISALLSSFNC